MAYQSYFSGGSAGTTATPAKSGGGYTSFFGSETIAQPSKEQLAKQRAQVKPQAPKTAPAPKSKGFLSKVIPIAKDLGKAAITSEKTAATGIARVLPGGTADIEAQQQQAEQASKSTAFAKKNIKRPELQKKVIAEQAKNTSQASKQTSETIKKMPTKGQVAAGFAGTIADIASAGTLGAAAKGAKAGKVFKEAEATTKAAKTASKAQKVVKASKEAAPLAVASSASAGLNAAAGGGSKKDITKNLVAGAVLPEALHIGGATVADVGHNLIDKVSTKGAKELATNVRTKNVLESLAAKQEAKQAKTAVAELPHESELVKPPEPAPIESTPVARPAETIATDIKDNATHIKTVTGKNPDSFLTPKKDGGYTINEDTPKEIKPYLDKHQELQKEYVAATSPAAPETAAGPVTKPATTTTALITEKSPESTIPDQGTSKIAKSVEQKAIENGLTEKYGELAQYDKLTIKDQAQKATDLINGDPQQLRRVVNGQEKLPEGLRSTALVDAVERHALKTGDTDLLRDLAKSTHVGESSRSAQELRLAAEREPDSATAKLKTLLDARRAALEKKLKGNSVDKAIKQEVAKAKVTVKRAVPDITKSDWNAFVDSVRC